MITGVVVYVAIVHLLTHFTIMGTRVNIFPFTLLIVVFALMVIIVLFTLIVVRIRRHSVQRAALGVAGLDAQHLTAVKMFSLITAFYLLGYVPFGLVASGLVPSEALFFYFVNHLCNPVIYFIFHARFRRDVIGLVNSIRQCF